MSLIASPGKFQGEKPWVPHFWSISLDGDYEPVEDDIIRVKVEPRDVLLFPDLAGARYVELWEREDGFVYGQVAA